MNTEHTVQKEQNKAMKRVYQTTLSNKSELPQTDPRDALHLAVLTHCTGRTELKWTGCVHKHCPVQFIVQFNFVGAVYKALRPSRRIQRWTPSARNKRRWSLKTLPSAVNNRSTIVACLSKILALGDGRNDVSNFAKSRV